MFSHLKVVIFSAALIATFHVFFSNPVKNKQIAVAIEKKSASTPVETTAQRQGRLFKEELLERPRVTAVSAHHQHKILRKIKESWEGQSTGLPLIKSRELVYFDDGCVGVDNERSFP